MWQIAVILGIVFYVVLVIARLKRNEQLLKILEFISLGILSLSIVSWLVGYSDIIFLASLIVAGGGPIAFFLLADVSSHIIQKFGGLEQTGRMLAIGGTILLAGCLISYLAISILDPSQVSALLDRGALNLLIAGVIVAILGAFICLITLLEWYSNLNGLEEDVPVSENSFKDDDAPFPRPIGNPIWRILEALTIFLLGVVGLLVILIAPSYFSSPSRWPLVLLVVILLGAGLFFTLYFWRKRSRLLTEERSKSIPPSP